MANLLLKLRIWTKIILMVLALIYTLTFMLMNSGQAVERLWLFPYKQYDRVSLLVVLFITFGIGVVGTLLVSMVLRTLRQVSDLRARSRNERMQRELEEMKSKASLLQTKPEQKTGDQ